MYDGIDVSHHQEPGSVDYGLYDFVYVRASYGSRADRTFHEHVKLARKAGRGVGAYHFYRKSQGVAGQLAMFKATTAGADLTLQPALDVESNARWDRYVLSRVDQIAIKAMLEGGHFGVIYTNPSDWQRIGLPVWGANYNLWLAHYTKHPRIPDPWQDYTIWQHEVRDNLDRNVAKSLPYIKTEPTLDTQARELIKLKAQSDDALKELDAIRNRSNKLIDQYNYQQAAVTETMNALAGIYAESQELIAKVGA